MFFILGLMFFFGAITRQPYTRTWKAAVYTSVLYGLTSAFMFFCSFYLPNTDWMITPKGFVKEVEEDIVCTQVAEGLKFSDYYSGDSLNGTPIVSYKSAKDYDEIKGGD